MMATRLVAAVLAALAVGAGGCSSDDTHPPPAPTGPFCELWTCVEQPQPIAALAIEYGSATDGGACEPWRFSLPEGDDAFTSIRTCGGNQIRCGNADYRVSTTVGTTITCTVAPTQSFHVRAHLSQSNGTHFDVEGDVDSSGGTVTLSAGTAGASDAGTAEIGPTSCRVTTVPYLWPGTISADFECTSISDASTCAVRGTFVFENCEKGTDGG